MQTPKIAILTVSQRVSLGVYPDLGGDALQAYLEEELSADLRCIRRVTTDDIYPIVQALTALAYEERCSLIVTTGGTGPAPTDVTPEATAQICQKMLPGWGEAMRARYVAQIPSVMLSRVQAGICGQTLIINLPGNPSAVIECISVVMPIIPHCVSLIGGAALELKHGKGVGFSRHEEYGS